MAIANVYAGICGFSTVVKTEMQEDLCKVSLESDCPAIQRMAVELNQVDPLKEISSRRKAPQIMQMGLKHCAHAACPVPVAIIKAVEVEAGLALPQDVLIKITK